MGRVFFSSQSCYLEFLIDIVVTSSHSSDIEFTHLSGASGDLKHSGMLILVQGFSGFPKASDMLLSSS